jgi:hypothetical protein
LTAAERIHALTQRANRLRLDADKAESANQRALARRLHSAADECIATAERYAAERTAAERHELTEGD